MKYPLYLIYMNIIYFYKINRITRIKKMKRFLLLFSKILRTVKKYTTKLRCFIIYYTTYI